MGDAAAAEECTPDGRYIIVRGRLWRRANPSLSSEDRSRFVHDLMNARRAIAKIKRTGEGDIAAARAAVDRAKTELGERGPVWWHDGAPDFTRRLARNTPYADWYATLGVDPRP